MAGFRLNASDLPFRDPEQAARHAARAVELKPGFAGSHRLLGAVRGRLHDWPGAIESLKKALELHARDVETIAECAERLAISPALGVLAEEVLANQREHLDRLTELAGQSEFAAV